MALPSSGPLTFADIQTEFGGSNPIGLNEYYAGGGLVPAGTSGTYGAVPSSGTISVQNFYGTQSLIPRGVIATGRITGFSISNVIQYISMSSTGNSTSFGTLATGVYDSAAGCASSTRGLWFGGLTTGSGDSGITTIQYVTISSPGTSTTFGNLALPSGSAVTQKSAAASNSTRGVVFGGQDNNPSPTNNMQYVTMATTGNTTLFGLLATTNYFSGACASTTRAVNGGGAGGSGFQMEYITIASTGNSTSFGNLPASPNSPIYQQNRGGSNATRGVFATPRTFNGTRYITSEVVNYITIATTGNALAFGNLTAQRGTMGICTNATQAVFCGGIYEGNTDSVLNTIDYITLATTGNALSWGTLATAIGNTAGVSNVHGGL